MSNPRVQIRKIYTFKVAGGPAGHISITNDGRAILVHLRYTDGQIERQVFTTSQNETAEVQAKKHVLKKIDANAEFFEDPSLDLCNWLLQNT